MGSLVYKVLLTAELFKVADFILNMAHFSMDPSGAFLLSMVAGLLVFLAIIYIFRCRKPGCTMMREENARNFFLFGIIFMVVGLVSTAASHGVEYTVNALLMFDITLFNIGLLFFVICLACMILRRVWKPKRVSKRT
jgi:hypothetical protein